MPDTYRYVTVPDAHSIHARYRSKQSILTVPDTRRYMSIPCFWCALDTDTIHVNTCGFSRCGFSRECKLPAPPAVRSILQNTHRYDAIHDDTRRYFKIHTDTRRYTTIRGDTCLVARQILYTTIHANKRKRDTNKTASTHTPSTLHSPHAPRGNVYSPRWSIAPAAHIGVHTELPCHMPAPTVT